MSHRYDPQCPHCTPAILDPETGAVSAPDSPEMVAVMKVWNVAPFAEREAFIAVTVDNSREPGHLSKIKPLMDRIQQALHNIDKSVS